MNVTNRSFAVRWTNAKALLLTTACLLAGIAGGWLIRGAQTAATPVATATTVTPAPANAVPDPAQLKSMADAKAAPLLDRLKADPSNPDLLTGLGNLYYDAQQYPLAVGYYTRTLQVQPSNVAVRTDRATAYWYMKDADTAIAEFNKALSYDPVNANALFNRGLVRWKGKMDAAGAVADWQKLLAANPNYEGKDKVLEMIAEATKQQAAKP